MAGSLDLKYILYTAFRLSPFIMVSFFTLSSILNQDLKGIIYLAGLLFACFFCLVMNNMSWFIHSIPPENELICNAMTISNSGRLSNIPLSLVVFTYTFGYLLFVIVHYKLVMQNIPTLIIFPAIILAEGAWNLSYKCATPFAVLAGVLIGGGLGVGWGALINKTGAAKLQYFNGISNSQTCFRPSKQKFKCTINN